MVYLYYYISVFLILTATSCSSLLTTNTESQIWTKENSLIESSETIKINEINNSEFKNALASSLNYIKKSSVKYLEYGNSKYSKDLQICSLEDLISYLNTNPTKFALEKYINKNFVIYKSKAKKVLVTGYYIPKIEVSKFKNSTYKYPIYKKPPDLFSVSLSEEIKKTLTLDVPIINRARLEKSKIYIPYYSRKDIDQKLVLSGKNLEIAYAKDPLDIFFLQIQGSGIAHFDDGSELLLAYSDKNGQPYIPIGKTLIDKGFLTKQNTSMFSIKEVLRLNPKLQSTILFSNPSYTFFELKNDLPRGNLGQPVIPNYSIATDQSIYPSGSIGFIKSNNINTLVVNLDTGGAIKGADHIDYFLGAGVEAEKIASGLKDQGELYFLAPSSCRNEKL